MTVFISHSFDNKPEFDNVAESLEQAGVDYWQPTEIASAGSLRDQLRSAIARCSVCIFIATRRSVESSWCGAELGAFWGAGVPIIVYLAESSLAENSLPPILQGDVWERRLSRVAARAKELAQAAQGAPEYDDASPSTRISSITVGQLELLVARAIATTGASAASQPLASSMPVADRALTGTSTESASRRRQLLIEERPYKWEYALWSLILAERIEELEQKWKDFESRTPGRPTLVLNTRNINSFPHDVVNTLHELLAEINELFSAQSKERTLGAPGDVGDPREIERIALALIDVYERLMDWSSELRGAQVSPRYVGLVGIAAEIPRRPAELIREFVRDFAQGMERITAGESFDLDLTLKVDLDSDVLDRFIAEYERVR